jgi:hypothetical protein
MLCVRRKKTIWWHILLPRLMQGWCYQTFSNASSVNFEFREAWAQLPHTTFFNHYKQHSIVTISLFPALAAGIEGKYFPSTAKTHYCCVLAWLALPAFIENTNNKYMNNTQSYKWGNRTTARAHYTLLRGYSLGKRWTQCCVTTWLSEIDVLLLILKYAIKVASFSFLPLELE